MPKIDRKLITKKADIVSDLKKIIKSENILHNEIVYYLVIFNNQRVFNENNLIKKVLNIIILTSDLNKHLECQLTN